MLEEHAIHGPRDRFKVIGRRPLHGTIRPQGNKNEALPLLAACCLSSETVTLENLPEIEDVLIMQDVLRALGVSVTYPDAATRTTACITAEKKPAWELPAQLSSQLRGSVTLAGPLLARCGRVFLPRPGGDKIGRRRLDTHMLALQALGAKINERRDGFEITAKRLKGADILLDEASVTGTENAVCAAALAQGETILRNAASEPHVQGLCRLLNGMGAHIRGIGSNILHIQGVDELHGAHHRIGPDYLEVGSFISLAAVTRGEILVQDADIPNLRMIRMVFERLGIRTVEQGDDLLVPAKQKMKIASDLGGAVPSIADAPWPGFPADMTSVALVTSTQCRGTVMIHEKMFESRLYFTDPLIGMGARIVLCDPHRAVVIGPERLRGARLSSPDIRAGMAMLIAALCAEGESEIQNIIQIDRGFTRIEERLRTLGAKITRESNGKA
jgi:UDP-N-acetylglucosamine 1-carboxyvinyltransferase